MLESGRVARWETGLRWGSGGCGQALGTVGRGSFTTLVALGMQGVEEGTLATPFFSIPT